MRMINHYHWRELLTASVCLMLVTGCTSAGRWKFVRNDGKSSAQKQVEHNQQEALKAAMEDATVPRKYDDLKDPASLQVAYGKWQEQIGQHNEARSSYEKALKTNPKSTDAIIGLARLDQLSERFTQAEKGYQKAVTDSPQSTVALEALGLYYVSQKRYTEAIPCLQKAVQIDPLNKTYHYDLAIAYAGNNQHDVALTEMTKAVGEAVALYNIGYLLNEKGMQQEGNRYIQMALQKDPKLQPALAYMNKAEKNTTQAINTAYQVTSDTTQKYSGRDLIQQQSFTTSAPLNAMAAKPSMINVPAATIKPIPISGSQIVIAPDQSQIPKAPVETKSVTTVTVPQTPVSQPVAKAQVVLPETQWKATTAKVSIPTANTTLKTNGLTQQQLEQLHNQTISNVRSH